MECFQMESILFIVGFSEEIYIPLLMYHGNLNVFFEVNS